MRFVGVTSSHLGSTAICRHGRHARASKAGLSRSGRAEEMLAHRPCRMVTSRAKCRGLRGPAGDFPGWPRKRRWTLSSWAAASSASPARSARRSAAYRSSFAIPVKRGAARATETPAAFQSKLALPDVGTRPVEEPSKLSPQSRPRLAPDYAKLPRIAPWIAGFHEGREHARLATGGDRARSPDEPRFRRAYASCDAH